MCDVYFVSFSLVWLLDFAFFLLRLNCLEALVQRRHLGVLLEFLTSWGRIQYQALPRQVLYPR